jgi:hypothetical protein
MLLSRISKTIQQTHILIAGTVFSAFPCFRVLETPHIEAETVAIIGKEAMNATQGCSHVLVLRSQQFDVGFGFPLIPLGVKRVFTCYIALPIRYHRIRVLIEKKKESRKHLAAVAASFGAVSFRSSFESGKLCYVFAKALTKQIFTTIFFYTAGLSLFSALEVLTFSQGKHSQR